MAILNAPAARQAAYDQLLAAARQRGDAGASDDMMAGILNGVDMGRADRTTGYWNARQKNLADSGTTMIDAVGAALRAARARAGSGGSGGGGGAQPLSASYAPSTNWYSDYVKSLGLISTPPISQAGAGRGRGGWGAGYKPGGYGTRPVAPKPRTGSGLTRWM
jgi:hypothetical protein